MILFQLRKLIVRHRGMSANYVFRTGQEFFLVSYGHYSIVVVTYPLQGRGKILKTRADFGIRHFSSTKK